MVELHSNLTIQGTKNVENGLYPSEHAWHETVEITHGFNDWFETGFYIFTAPSPGMAGNGLAITYGRAFACRNASTGRLG
jgi:hypothetical protein